MVRICFSEAQNGKSVSLYRQTLQNSLVNNLITRFTGMKEKSTSLARADVLFMLKSIQSKVKNAGSDAKSRAHFQNLYDMIERALVVK